MILDKVMNLMNMSTECVYAVDMYILVTKIVFRQKTFDSLTITQSNQVSMCRGRDTRYDNLVTYTDEIMEVVSHVI